KEVLEEARVTLDALKKRTLIDFSALPQRPSKRTMMMTGTNSGPNIEKICTISGWLLKTRGSSSSLCLTG
ncbi:MAG: hypothetical protein ACJ70Q_07660, partial [Nitrososphaera sp.]